MSEQAESIVLQGVTVSETIQAPASAVWLEVANPAGWERWIDFLTGSTVQGRGTGASRICHTDSGDIHEVIEMVDEDSMTFEYSIRSAPMPIHNARGRIQVVDQGNERAMVTWSITFQTSAAAAEELKATIEEIYRSSIANLERLVAEAGAAGAAGA